MNINTKSWHYRLIDYVSMDRPPENLCPYIRRVIRCIISSICGIAFVIAASIAGTFFLAYPILPYIDPNLFAGNLAILSGVLYTGLGLIGLMAYRDTGEYRKKDQLRREVKKSKKKPPGLFRMWLKAKHDKICPALDFK